MVNRGNLANITEIESLPSITSNRSYKNNKDDIVLQKLSGMWTKSDLSTQPFDKVRRNTRCKSKGIPFIINIIGEVIVGDIKVLSLCAYSLLINVSPLGGD